MSADPRVGKIYMDYSFPNFGKVRMFRVLIIYFDPAYYGNVMKYKTNDGEIHLDRAVLCSYYREATPEEILLYWPENE